MTVGDNLAGVFGSLNGSHLGNLQRVPLGNLIIPNLLNGVRAGRYHGLGPGRTKSLDFKGNVPHGVSLLLQSWVCSPGMRVPPSADAPPAFAIRFDEREHAARHRLSRFAERFVSSVLPGKTGRF